MAGAAVAPCRHERYRGAGTVEFVVDGIATKSAHLAACMEHPEFVAGGVTTDFINRNHRALLG